MDQTNYYYLDGENQPQGPVTPEQLATLRSMGILSGESYVAREGDADWKTYEEAVGPAPLAGSEAPHPVPAAAPAPAQTPSNPLALASLILGCLCLLFWFLTALPAIICGVLALSTIGKTPGLGGRGQAIAGICLGSFFLVLSVTGIIASLAIPATMNAKSKAQETQVLAEIRSVGMVLMQYSLDNQEYPPNLDVLKEGTYRVDENLLFIPGTNQFKWKLTPGLTDASPPATVLLESVDDYPPGMHRGKAVFQVGGATLWIDDNRSGTQ